MKNESELRRKEMIILCCNCNRVKNKEGKWEEEEIKTEKISHGICPKCIKRDCQEKCV